MKIINNKTKVQNILLLFLLGISINLNAQTLEDCSKCNSQKIKSSEIENIGVEEARILINEIYARKGYTFEDAGLNIYFGFQSWYKPKEDNSNIHLNKTEEYNVKVLRSHQKEKQKERELLIKNLAELKLAIQENDHSTLLSKYAFTTESEFEKSEYPNLQKFMSFIRPKDLHFLNEKAIYEIQLDDGREQIEYKLKIVDNQLIIECSVQGQTGLVKNEKDRQLLFNYGYEKMTWWYFDINNDRQIKFYRIEGAG